MKIPHSCFKIKSWYTLCCIQWRLYHTSGPDHHSWGNWHIGNHFLTLRLLPFQFAICPGEYRYIKCRHGISYKPFHGLHHKAAMHVAVIMIAHLVYSYFYSLLLFSIVSYLCDIQYLMEYSCSSLFLGRYSTEKREHSCIIALSPLFLPPSLSVCFSPSPNGLSSPSGKDSEAFCSCGSR